MKNDILDKLLPPENERAQERIAKELPPKMDMDRMFQRSMDKYQGIEAPHAVPVWKRTGFRAALGAACLLLTLGLVSGVWAKRQHIETLPPETTPAVQTTVTTATEPSAAPETTAAPTTARSTAPRRTTASPQTTAPAETTMLPTDTVPATTAPPIAASIPERTAARTAPPSPAVTVPETNVPMTADLSRPEPVTSLPESTAEITETAPATETPPRPTECPDTETPVTELHSVPKTEPTETGSIMTEPAYPTISTAFPIVGSHQLCFWGSQLRDTVETVILPDLTPSPVPILRYTMQGVPFSAEPLETEHEMRVRAYRITQLEGGTHQYFLTQSVRDAFCCRYAEGDILEPAEISGNPAVIVRDGELCALCWDDGQYTFRIESKLEYLPIMKDIAAGFQPVAY